MRAHGRTERVIDMDTGAKRDWGLVVGGIALVIIGFVLLLWPGLTMVSVATLAGIMFLVAGVLDIVNIFRFREQGSSIAWAVVNAVLNVVLGVLFLWHPLTGAIVLAWWLGAFIMAYGVFAIATAVGMRGAGTGWGWMLCNGIVSVICGVAFFFMPEMFAYFLGFFLMMRGVTMAVYGATAPQVLHGRFFGL